MFLFLDFDFALLIYLENISYTNTCLLTCPCRTRYVVSQLVYLLFLPKQDSPARSL